MIDKNGVYLRIGMALVSAQRVEFVSGELLKVLENFEGGNFDVTSKEFFEKSAKSTKTFKTLGHIFSLHKLNPTLVIEDEFNAYLKKRNILVHEFWNQYLFLPKRNLRRMNFTLLGYFTQRVTLLNCL